MPGGSASDSTTTDSTTSAYEALFKALDQVVNSLTAQDGSTASQRYTTLLQSLSQAA